MVDQPGRINRDLDKKTYFDKFFPMYNRYTDDLIFNIFIKNDYEYFSHFILFVNLSFNVDNKREKKNRKTDKLKNAGVNNNYFK